jgi:hypothetical protein
LPTVQAIESWPLPEFIKNPPEIGLKIHTDHYEIFTTLQDPLILRRLPVFFETAYLSYCNVFGQNVETQNKLPVYFFDNRRQWEDFTRHWTGPMADVYLQIRAGAYYLNKACVAYHLSRKSNFAVLAHEGWHQFSDEIFRYRLPAWLDEGLATNYEAYQWTDGKVTFSPRMNGPRLTDLQKTLAAGTAMPLADLLSMDAGRVMSHSNFNLNNQANAPSRIAAYYAQLYALVRFLREDNYGRRLLLFRTMLNDGRQGNWPLSDELKAEALQRQRNPSRRWNAITGPLLFQTYITKDLPTIEKQYTNFCRKISLSVHTRR